MQKYDPIHYRSTHLATTLPQQDSTLLPDLNEERSFQVLCEMPNPAG